MFGLFKQKSKGIVATFAISGMHCVSCSLNIDGALEDTEGVIQSRSHFAKGVTMVQYDPTKISLTELKDVIEKAGYIAQIA